jgi:glycosyltransferase involved in cell wall biosynthesis/FMN phosphatase YigB (HAD superfamily)
MQQPLVSVVIPAYNHERFVVEAIESALSQDVEGLECIVIDDASGDGTWARIGTIDDDRLRTLRHDTNRGAHATLNEALDAARGRFITILNSDDRYAPGRLGACIERLQAGCDLVGTDIRLIDSDGKEVAGHWWIDAFDELKAVHKDGADWAATLLEGNVFMTTSNMVFTRGLWQRLRPLRDFRYVHDYDFVLRALGAGARLEWVDAALLDYRLHESNTISASPLHANLECSTLLREHLPALVENSADQAAALRHLASQWARNERYEVEILLALQHEALVEKDRDWGRLVEDRDRWIAERDEWIAERDAVIAEHGTLLRERDENIASLHASLKQIHERPLQYFVRGAARKLRRHTGALTGRSRRMLHSMRMPAGHFPERVGGFDALRTLVEHKSGLSAISFDIFDTLVQRCVEPPEWIHRRVADELAHALGRQGELDLIWSARRDAEARLRTQATNGGGDHECHYDELLRAWVAQLCGHEDAELIGRIEAFEGRLEHLALVAKPGARAFLEWAHARGLRLIAVSDMYLGEAHIREILTHCGLADLLDAIHVSSEHGLGKYSTRLHAHVLELEGLAADAVLHVGDNLYADALAPCRIGMHGAWFDEPTVRRRRRRQKRAAAMSARGGIWPGRMQAEIVAQRLETDPRAQATDPYFRYGLEVLGPMFALFTLGLVERLRERPPQRLMFLARDGHLFMRLYDRWRELDADDALPVSAYVYASRRVVSSAAVADGLKAEMIPIALANPKQRGLESILRTYGLPVDEFREIADAHGLTPIDAPIEGAEDPRLTTFLDDDDAQTCIRGHGRQARELLEAYFEQQGFFDAQRVAFVDIGWNGTIQHFLAESFGERPDYPDVAGYYFALVNSFHAPGDRCGITDGLMLDGKRNNPCERAAVDFEELFEQGARALEATTLGYARDEGGRVLPILKDDSAPDRIAELQCNPSIQAMQEGMLLHLEHFHAAHSLTGFDFAALRPYCMGLIERAVVYPEPDEVELVGRLAHSEDFGHDHVLDISDGDLGWRDFVSPRRLSRRLRARAWRYAPLARFRNPIPAWLARIAHLRQIRSRG